MTCNTRVPCTLTVPVCSFQLWRHTHHTALAGMNCFDCVKCHNLHTSRKQADAARCGGVASVHWAWPQLLLLSFVMMAVWASLISCACSCWPQVPMTQYRPAAHEMLRHGLRLVTEGQAFRCWLYCKWQGHPFGSEGSLSCHRLYHP